MIAGLFAKMQKIQAKCCFLFKYGYKITVAENLISLNVKEEKK